MNALKLSLILRLFVAGLTLPLMADMEVFKSIVGGLTVVDSGQTFTYKLQYRAASTTTDFFGATLTDVLPEGLEYQSLQGTVHVDHFSYTAATRELKVHFVDPLPAGSTGDIEVNVRFRPGTTLPDAVAVNTASIEATNSPPRSSAPVTIRARAQNKVSVLKDLLGSSVPLNQNVTYRLRVLNTATVAALNISDLTLVDALPAGAEFVAASNGGVYDADAHSVTWTEAALSVGSTLTRTVTIRYTESAFALGNSVTNPMVLTYTPAGGSPEQLSHSVTHSIVAPQGGATFTKSVNGNYVYEGKEASKSWSFALTNTGNVPMENVVVTDPVPVELNVTSINTARLQGTPPDLQDPIRVFFQTNLNAAWTALPGNPYAGLTNSTVSVASLGLAPTERITSLKWEFGNIPVGYQVSNLGFGSTILTTDRDGNAVNTGRVVRNTAQLRYENFSGTIDREASASLTVKSPRPVAELGKSASPSTVNDGDTTTFTLTLKNLTEAARDLQNPVIADLLDAKLRYVEGSWEVLNKPVGAPDPVFEHLSDYDGSGRSLLRWSWTGPAAYDLGINRQVQIRFRAEIPRGTLFGAIQNDLALLSWGNEVIDTSGTTARADTFDIDGDGNRVETFHTRRAAVTVRGRASMDSVKWVKGELDAVWHKYPQSGFTVPGGRADYRLIVENTGNVPIRNAVILDILPIIGDTGVIDLSQRDTEWIAALAAPVTAPTGVKVYYSRSSNPQRPDFDSNGPAGALPPEWSLTPPATLTEARALLFVFEDITIQPAASFELAWPMRSPVGTPTDGSVAWNSFGYYGTRTDSNTNLLPSEPIKVGIAIQPDENASYGDRVWLDSNRNGLQDDGEIGLNGIRVELYEDNGPGLFGDGIANPAQDRLVGFTITADDYNGAPGYYLFPNLDRGNYYAVFHIPPGYGVSPAHVGADDGLDSDVDAATGYTPITTIDAQEVDRSWDLGLWLPPSSISLVKTAGAAPDGSDLWILPSTAVTYSYTLTNTGELPLVRLRVMDDKLGQIALLDGPLAPGASVTVTKVSPPLTEGVVNIGSVRAHPADLINGIEIPGAPPVEAQDDASVLVYASLGNYVWHDVNLNGVQDADESPVPGTLVNLHNADGDVIDTRTTPANGRYLFTGLLPGSYSLSFTPPTGYVLSASNQGGNAEKDSDPNPLTGRTGAIVLVAGQSDLSWDAGLWRPASLGDRVWIDTNANGLQDGDETGLNGVTVRLLHASGEPVLDALGSPLSTQTSTGPGGDGFYEFRDLVPAAYRVEFVLPAAYIFSPRDADLAGINGAANSDADEATGITLPVTLTAATHQPRIDAGLVPANPAIRLVKTADQATYSIDGESITYRFRVENTGNVPLTQVQVSDPLLTVLGGPISLAVGEVDDSTFHGSYAITLADLNAGSRPNTARVEGRDPRSGEIVEDTDDETITALQQPLLTLSKTGTFRSGSGAGCDTLGVAQSVNALIFGDLEANGGDTEGRLVVGGSAAFVNGYSVGISVVGAPIDPLIGSAVDMLIVGGDLADGVWGVNGNVVFGGTRTGAYRYQENGNVTRHVVPVTLDAQANVPSDGSGAGFAALRADMEIRSALFAALSDRGVVLKDSDTPHHLILVGDDPVLNVFNLTAAQWSVSSSEIRITAPDTSTVLVNVHGTPVRIVTSAMSLSGVTPNQVLVNLVDATDIEMRGFTLRGSLLAPYANANFVGGGIDGTAVLGGNVHTETGFEFHHFPFSGSICLEIVYSFEVANAGNVTLTDIQIDDPLVSVVGGPLSLDPGGSDSSTFTAVYALTPSDIVNGSFTNTAIASAQPPFGARVTASGSDTRTFNIPGIGSGGTAGAGGTGSSGGSAGIVGPPPAPEAPPETWMKADVVVRDIDLLPAPLVPGQSFSARITLVNEGHAASTAGTLRLWLHKPVIAAPGEAADASMAVASLAPGETRVLTFAGLAAPALGGDFSLRAFADPTDLGPEYSVGNNQLSAAYTLHAADSPVTPAWMKPDFVVQSVELVPSPTITSAHFAVVVRVLNQGDIAGDAGTLSFWASSPSWVNLPALPDHSGAIGVLAPGEVKELVFNNLVAPDLKGTYHARVRVDAANLSDEKSEGNNDGGATYTVFPLTVEIEAVPEGRRLTWNAAPGYRYTVERSTSLVDGFNPIAQDLPATPPENSFLDSDIPEGGLIFYRVWGTK